MKTIKISSVIFAFFCIFIISCSNDGCKDFNLFSIAKSASEPISLTEYNSLETIYLNHNNFCEDNYSKYYGKTLKIEGWYRNTDNPYLCNDSNINYAYSIAIIMSSNDTILQKIADSAANFPCYITGKFLYDCISYNECGPQSSRNYRIEITNSNQITFNLNENEK